MCAQNAPENAAPSPGDHDHDAVPVVHVAMRVNDLIALHDNATAIIIGRFPDRAYYPSHRCLDLDPLTAPEPLPPALVVIHAGIVPVVLPVCRRCQGIMFACHRDLPHRVLRLCQPNRRSLDFDRAESDVCPPIPGVACGPRDRISDCAPGLGPVIGIPWSSVRQNAVSHPAF